MSLGYFMGEYDGKLDDRGRLAIPVNLLKEIPDNERETLFVVRGLDPCLEVMTKSEMDKIVAEINSLDHDIEVNRLYANRRLNGGKDCTIDNSNRINLPPRLMSYAGLSNKDKVVVVGSIRRIQIWKEETYEAHLNKGGSMSELAEMVAKLKKHD